MAVFIIFVAARVYHLWHSGPWALPAATKPRPIAPAPAADEELPQFQLANTRNIIDKNLFDPERGTTRQKEDIAQRDNAARQRIRSMVLMGTAILGNSKYVILQDPTATPRPGAPNTKAAQQAGQGQTRLKLGDTFEGFRVSEIRDKSVVFTKGPIREELSIDFFRPADPQPQQATAGPAQQRPIAPRVGARVVPPAGNQTQAQQEGGTAVERARRALRERQLQPPQQPSGRPAEGAAPTPQP
ncbi:MAG TPA: hypothetical protein VGH16_12700 [Candidatus Binatia bacterium]